MKMIKPTDKQKLFVKNRSRGMSNRKAALEAGYSMSVANDASRKIAEAQGTKTALEKLRKALDIISEEDIAITIKHAMLAERSDMTGTVFPDHRTRLVAADSAAKYKGAIPTEKHDVDVHGDMNIQIINFSGSSKKDDDETL